MAKVDATAKMIAEKAFQAARKSPPAVPASWEGDDTPPPKKDGAPPPPKKDGASAPPAAKKDGASAGASAPPPPKKDGAPPPAKKGGPAPPPAKKSGTVHPPPAKKSGPAHPPPAKKAGAPPKKGGPAHPPPPAKKGGPAQPPTILKRPAAASKKVRIVMKRPARADENEDEEEEEEVKEHDEHVEDAEHEEENEAPKKKQKKNEPEKKGEPEGEPPKKKMATSKISKMLDGWSDSIQVKEEPAPEELSAEELVTVDEGDNQYRSKCNAFNLLVKSGKLPLPVKDLWESIRDKPGVRDKKRALIESTMVLKAGKYCFNESSPAFKAMKESLTYFECN